MPGRVRRPGAVAPHRGLLAELVRAVWDDDPPRTADKNLQSHVVRLRKAVGPTTIVRVGAASQLDVGPAAIDVARFQPVTPGGNELVDASREAVAWLRGRDEAYLGDWMQIVGVAAGLLRTGAFAEHDHYVTELTDRHREGGPPTFVHWTLFMGAYSALLAWRLLRRRAALRRRSRDPGPGRDVLGQPSRGRPRRVPRR